MTSVETSVKWDKATCSVATVAGRLELSFTVPAYAAKYTLGKVASADQLPVARRYFSDGLAIYAELVYPEGGQHVLSVGKAQTHTVEGMNANRSPYLGRLKRRSRCFSREPRKLWQAVRLFVWPNPRRQRVILANPKLKNALTLVF